jgi:hypothetical protein
MFEIGNFEVCYLLLVIDLFIIAFWDLVFEYWNLEFGA